MNTTLLNSTTGIKDNWTFNIISTFNILIYVINYLLGFPLNVYIIILLSPRCRGLDMLPDLNLAIADIFLVPMAPLQCLCSINLEWCFFKPVGFLLTTCMSARTLFQCWLCVERYMAVIHPVMFLKYKPLRYHLSCCMLLWTAVLLFGITGMLKFPYLPYKVFMALYLFILTVDIFCGMSILKGLRHPGPRDKGKEEGDISAAKKKAFRIVATNLLIFLIQNIPVAIIFGLQTNLSRYSFNMATVITLAINIFTGFLQPVSVLRRAGKLSFQRYVWSPAYCSGATMSTQCIV